MTDSWHVVSFEEVKQKIRVTELCQTIHVAQSSLAQCVAPNDWRTLSEHNKHYFYSVNPFST